MQDSLIKNKERMKMKAKIKLRLQYVAMEVKRKENKIKGFMVEVEFAINLKDRQNFRKVGSYGK